MKSRKSKRTTCFDLQFCHYQLWNHNPKITNTNNQTITGLQTSKLWVKTRTLHTGNRASPTPQIPQSWNNVFFHISRVGWNCSEIVTSGRIFVLTLNRASALKVKGNEQNFLLRLHLVSTTYRIGLESKLSQLWQLQATNKISCCVKLQLQPQKESV